MTSTNTSSMFKFNANDKVIWLAPATRSIYASYVSSEIKADGNEWITLMPLPAMANAKFSGDAFVVLAEQVIPAFE